MRISFLIPILCAASCLWPRFRASAFRISLIPILCAAASCIFWQTTATAATPAIQDGATDSAGKPATYSGVLTFREPGGGGFFLQHAGGGLFVRPRKDQTVPPPGTGITATGTLAGEEGALWLDAATVDGKEPGAWPAPVRTTAQAVWKNTYYGQWVEIEGWLVDAAVVAPGIIHLAVGTTEGTAFVAVYDPPPGFISADWKDAVVRLRGVNAVEDGIFLHVPGVSQVERVRTGLAAAFSAPEVSAAALLKNPAPPARIRLRATMTANAFGQASAFLSGETGFTAHGLRPLVAGRRLFEPPQLPTLQPGDEVEMAGFPAITGGHLSLLHTEVKLLQKGPPPPPLPATLAEVAGGRVHGRLVTVQARLVTAGTQAVERTALAVLTLEDGGRLLQASLPLPEGQPLTTLPADYLTEVTGVVFPPAEGGSVPRLLLRTASDALSLRLAYTAVTRRALQAGGMALAAGAGLMGWILALRRRVKQKTAEGKALRIEIDERMRAEAQVRELNTTLEQRVADRTADLEQSGAELQKALAAERDLNRLKSNFVSMVSHEFRTPLGIISVSAELLNRYGSRLNPAQQEEHLLAIFSSARRMAGMMESILLLSRVDTGRLECQPLRLDLPGLCRRLVDEAHSLTGGANQIQFIDGSGTEEPAMADEALLRHILSNLLSNACKYSPDGSPVTLEVTKDGRLAVFRITDRGIGIPEEDQEQLFLSFHRGRNVGHIPGTGLGLIIVKRCIDLHGGTIAVHSAPGSGTVFTVSLPLFP